MIPWFRFTYIPFGPVHIQVWGLMVAMGLIVASMVGAREAKRRGLSPEVFFDFATWIMIAALIGGRLLFCYAYAPATYLADPLRVLKVWEGGMSSFGGFIGAAVGAALFVRLRRISFLRYADVACYALPLGYGIGRIGCFLIHDHPGTLSHSLLAVRYPGGARLDHGLLLSMTGFGLFAIFYSLNQKRIREGRAEGGFLPLFMVLYGVIRFALDFFRATDLVGADVRYGGLTPAQYGCVLMVVGGAWWLVRLRRGLTNPVSLHA